MSRSRIAIRSINVSLASLCLGSTCIGLTVGWAHNCLSESRENESCPKCAADEISARQLVFNLGACLGALVPPCLVDIFGRRHNFAIAAGFNVLFWLLLAISRAASDVVAESTMGGIATGLFLVTATMYVGEVSSSDCRGRTATSVMFFAYFGILLGAILDQVNKTWIVPVAICILPLLFLATVYLWMAESPYFLYEKGQTLKAKLAIKALRGARNILDVDSEYKSIELFFESKGEWLPEQTNLFCSVFLGYSGKAWTTLIMILLFVSQMVGTYAMEEYTIKFIDKLLPVYGKILLASIDLVSIGLCVFLIERVGRKPLLLLSIAGSSASCLMLAIDGLLHELHSKLLVNNEQIITFVIVVSYYTSYSIGLTPILPLLTGEVFPNRIKTIAIGVCISVIYLSLMINQSIFELLDAKRGTYMAFIVFSFIGSLGLLSIFAFLPETSSKSLYEIQSELDDFTIIMA